MSNWQQISRFKNDKGFIAALDQSGGSTPRALRQYGVDDTKYSNEAEMFDLIHQARTRIITSPVFTNERILAAILFQGTIERQIEGRGTAEYLWNAKGIIPFLKIDKGLADEDEGVQLMKDIPGLEEVLAKGVELGAFGTKERSVIHAANPEGIKKVVDQQFELAYQVIAAGLMPIVEPEVDIKAADKTEIEKILKTELLKHLDELGGKKVALKLTLPSTSGYYTELIAHPGVTRVAALSGGYTRDEANVMLAANPGMIASFSRALLEGLTIDQSAEDFNRTLNASIESIYLASIT